MLNAPARVILICLLMDEAAYQADFGLLAARADFVIIGILLDDRPFMPVEWPLNEVYHLASERR